MSKETNINEIGVNLNRNLSKLMDDNQISLSALHRNTGIPIPTIKRLQIDPTTNPTITTLLPIANFFGITIGHLIGNELPTGIIGYLENKEHWSKVPLIEWNQIIDWLKCDQKSKIYSYVLVDIDIGEKDFALKVEKDEWPTIAQGSILIINTELTPEHKDYAIVNKKGQIIPTLKQVLVDEERIYLQSCNPHFQPILFDENYHFIGVLMQIRKDTKV
ncbi:S24 family peptidase [Legionella gresilensis]|uniref:S24 family peptidase n=1 Tax=Legionella gresilensis TaxID=91823 RepID=UPI0010419E76|nr:S24 family peptidase [Legionella gresilensis]